MTSEQLVEVELQKNTDIKQEDLDQLRVWLAKNPYLPPISERQLMLFHHSCYYDVEKTKSCIVAYYTLRSNTPEFFKNRDVTNPELQTALRVLVFCEFPVCDPNGYHIIFHRLRDFEPSHYVFNDGCKLLIMMGDACQQIHGPLPGGIILFDMEGVRLGHLTRLGFTPLRRLFSYVQEGTPVRLKAVHVVNVSPLIDKIMFLIKPLMKKELIKILHFHKGNNETLYDFLPKSCLPVEYGGDLESVEVLHERSVKNLQSLKAYFDEEESYRIDEKKKSQCKKSKSMALDPPVPVQLKSLDID